MKSRKPVVGVVPLFDEEKDSIWMLPGYLQGLQDAGAIPVILPFTGSRLDYEILDAQIDGYLFTGGHDIDPALYGEKKLPQCGAISRERDALEPLLYEFALRQNKPLLGICRGIQMINVIEGGNLYQDLPSQHKSETDHHMKPPYDRTVHSVTVKEDSPLFQLWGKTEKLVNSYHHQAIRTVAAALKVMAVSEDGIVEAVCRPDHPFLWGVQWHPEFIYQKDEEQKKIFEAFVKAMS
ncbi:MAG: gamma-glutamyl-gamma-aminobutyrate hydrolase family protein [Lachnospiraceae bacterium]